MASNVSPDYSKYKNSVYQFKISLKYIKPPIWRRVLVPGDYTFKDLHYVIQNIMTWSNTHMHKFNFDDHVTGKKIEVGGMRDCDTFNFDGTKHVPVSTKLCTYFKKENFKATYDYDFGSTWEHIILLEKILPADRTKKYPQCIAGRRATPPEHGSPDECEEYTDPEFFDAKLIKFHKCRDFLKDDEEVLSDNDSYDSYGYYGPIAYSEVESDPESTASGSELASTTTKLVEQAIDNRKKVVDFLTSQNSNEIASSKLPQKRKAPEDEEPNSVPAKLIGSKIKDLQINNTILETTRITENSESSNSVGHAKNIIVPSVTEDAEDFYGKFIASQMRDIKDLKRREVLRIEIQQLISKYRLKN